MSTVYSKGESISLEHTLRGMFNCDRAGFGGIISSEVIETEPVQALILGLSLKYVNADDSIREEIDSFIEELEEYKNEKMYEIKEEEFKRVVEKFNSLVK